MILDLLKNPYFVIPVISFFIAQLAKFAIRVWRGEGEGFMRRFMGSGEMPSSHTAMVTSLAITAAFEDGLDSPYFGISFVLAAIVIYDALNVRQAVGKHGGVLLHLIERARVPKEERERFDLGKALGHRPIEVIVGATLATAISLVLEHDKWWDWFYQGLSSISETDIKVFYGLSAAAVVVGLLATAIFRRRNLRKLPTSKAIIRSVSRGLIAPGLTGLLLTWLLQERIGRLGFDTAIWLFVVLAWGVVVLSIASVRTFSGALERLADEKEHFSEEKKRARQTRRKKSKKRR